MLSSVSQTSPRCPPGNWEGAKTRTVWDAPRTGLRNPGLEDSFGCDSCQVPGM
uniref:Uncharacterized protein n=1 Tax=Paramormyrops kingsleyae TaxID=1676925 RepID=A0A3B3Q3B9_9TELE